MNCWFNDIVGGCTFIALVNLLLSWYGYRTFSNIIYISAILLLCGIFWEYVTPLFRHSTTSDPYDILAYISGGIIYTIILKINAYVKIRRQNTYTIKPDSREKK